MKTLLMIALGGLLGACMTEGPEDTTATAIDELVIGGGPGGSGFPNNLPFADASGQFTTVSTQGSIDLGNEFFQNLGTNGRRCVSCHVPSVGWSVTPAQLQAVFAATGGGAFDDGFGLAAAFRTNDGANAPNANVSSLAARRAAYSMLLSRGVIRVGLAVPTSAEFELVAVDDPYHFATAAELSLFRRPLPTTNLKFDSTVMWDGREVIPGQPVSTMLLNQANDATVGHAQGQPLTLAQRQSIVDFEVALTSGQIFDRQAHGLSDTGARGGPDAILAQSFYVGINDNLGDSRTGAPFNPIVFDVFNAWTSAAGPDAAARRSIARGQALFNTHPIAITGVSGINDEPAFGQPATLIGSCSTCHDTPNGGNHSVVAPLDLGISDAARRTPDMPLYTLRNKATGELRQTTDPGRAMIDGKWNHIGRFKGPMLRNLAARPPYFHNGSAGDLATVVDFYDQRFAIGLSAQDKADLSAFLAAL
jgi:cytochrome c peroxidase